MRWLYGWRWWCFYTLFLGVIVAGYAWRIQTSETEVSQPPQSSDFQLSSAMVPGVYTTLATMSAELKPHASISAILVSHHLLASQLITNHVQPACKTSPETIVLISPDHFGAFRHEPVEILAMVTQFNWQTPKGLRLSDEKLATQLALAEGVKKISDPAKIGHEHGIFALLPFLDSYCGHTKLVAVLVRPQSLENKLAELGSIVSDFAKNSSQRILLVVSSDFSHESTLEQVRQQDGQSEKILKLLGNPTANIVYSEVTSDCPGCLVVLSGYLERNGSIRLVQLEHKNSADFGGNLNNITSYFGASWANQP